MEMNGIQPLVCPECGNELEGLSSDAVFFCKYCQTAAEITPGGLKMYPVTVAYPEKESLKPDVCIPFWSFEISVEVRLNGAGTECPPNMAVHAFEHMQRKIMDTAQRVVGHWTRVLVPAIRMFRPSYYGDPGFIYSCLQKEIPSFKQERGIGQFVMLGASRKLVDAARYPRLYALLAVDRIIDITKLDLVIQFKNAQILGIPFARVHDRAFDCVLKRDYPSFLFEDWEAMTDRQKKFRG